MKLNVNGVEINYVIEGEGPWLTMSHSLGSNLTMWDPQAGPLSKRFKVLRFDTRGHGQSSAPQGPYTLEQLADDVHGLYAALGIKRSHWVGLSLGGMIGQTYELKYPGTFLSMVLADTASRRHADAATRWSERVRIAQEKGMGAIVDGAIARWFTEPYRNAHKDVVRLFSDHIRSTPVTGYAGCCRAIAGLDLTDRLKEIKCPALVVVGEQDHGTPPEMAREIHENLPGSELCIIPSAAHFSSYEQPEIFNKAVLEFLGKAKKG